MNSFSLGEKKNFMTVGRSGISLQSAYIEKLINVNKMQSGVKQPLDEYDRVYLFVNRCSGAFDFSLQSDCKFSKNYLISFAILK